MCILAMERDATVAGLACLSGLVFVAACSPLRRYFVMPDALPFPPVLQTLGNGKNILVLPGKATYMYWKLII